MGRVTFSESKSAQAAVGDPSFAKERLVVKTVDITRAPCLHPSVVAITLDDN